MRPLVGLVDNLFWLYELMILARIVMSWIRVSYYNPWVRLIARITDPYLNLFRSIIPPLGAFDFSPIIALFVLVMLRRVVLTLLVAGF